MVAMGTQKAREKSRKSKTAISITMNPFVLAALDAACDKNGRTRSEMIDRAVEEYLRNHAAEFTSGN